MTLANVQRVTCVKFILLTVIFYILHFQITSVIGVSIRKASNRTPCATRRECEKRQIWWLTKSETYNQPTTTKFLPNHGVAGAEENAGSQIIGDSVLKNLASGIERTRRNADAAPDTELFSGRSRDRFQWNERNERENGNTRQTNGYFDNREIAADDIPYTSPSFSRNSKTELFRHYQEFTDNDEHKLRSGYADGGLSFQRVNSHNAFSNPSYDDVNEGQMVGGYGDSKTPAYGKADAPKIVVKDGQVFYPHDSKLYGNDPKVKSIPKSEDHYATTEKTPFQLFTDEAQKLHIGSSAIARRGFNQLLDQVRQMGSQMPITSAAIAAAAVKGDKKGSSSHAVGTALNQGYFASVASGRDSSGGLTHSMVQGHGQSSRGNAEAVAPRKIGNTYVSVDHTHGGSAHGYSETLNGDVTVSANITHYPKSSQEGISGRSSAEASSNVRATFEKNNSEKTAEMEMYDSHLGKTLPSQRPVYQNMMDNVMEKVHKPDLVYSSYISETDRVQPGSIFNEGYAEFGRKPMNGFIIDQGGLLVGAGEPPKEAHIEQVSVGNLPEGGFPSEENTGYPYVRYGGAVGSERVLENILKTKEGKWANTKNHIEDHNLEKLRELPRNSFQTSLTNGQHGDTNIFARYVNNIGNNDRVSEHTSSNSLPKRKVSKTLTSESIASSDHVNYFPEYSDLDYDDQPDYGPLDQKWSYSDLNKKSLPYSQSSNDRKLNGKVSSGAEHDEYRKSNHLDRKNITHESHSSLPVAEDTEDEYSEDPLHKMVEPELLSKADDKNGAHSDVHKSEPPQDYSADTNQHVPSHFLDSDIPTFFSPSVIHNQVPSEENLPSYYSGSQDYEDGLSYNDMVSRRLDGTGQYYSPEKTDNGINNKHTQHSSSLNRIEGSSQIQDRITMLTEKMPPPTTLLFPVVVPHSNEMDEDITVLTPGRPGIIQTLAPAEPGKPMIKLMTVDKDRSRVLLHQRESIPIEPGDKIPGTPGYVVPSGFRGRVILGHSLPVEVESRKVVKGFTTHVRLQPQEGNTEPVFALVGGPEASSDIGLNDKTGVHVMLSAPTSQRILPHIRDDSPTNSRRTYVTSKRSQQEFAADKIHRDQSHVSHAEDRRVRPAASRDCRRPKKGRSSICQSTSAARCGSYSETCRRMKSSSRMTRICFPILISVCCC